MAASHGRNDHLLRTVRAQRRRRARRHWLGAAVALGLLLYVIVFGDAGWLAVRDAEHDVADLRAELEGLRAARAQHEAEAAALAEPGGVALERAARELYRMQRPDEEVHHLVGGEEQQTDDGAS